MHVRVNVEGAERTSAEFKRARKEVRSRMRTAILTAAEREVLPDARRNAPAVSGRLRGSLIVRGKYNGAYITTKMRGKRARYVGLHEFGGTVTAPITPKRRRNSNRSALRINGAFVGSVQAPRTYRGQRFASKAVLANGPAVLRELKTELAKSLGGLS